MKPLNLLITGTQSSIATLRPGKRRSSGMSLIIVLLILIVVSVIGLGSAQLALLGSKSTRYDRDRQVAWEAAEAALVDAQYDIAGPNTASNSRVALFPSYSGTTTPNLSYFATNCGTDTNAGMCVPNASGTLPLAYTANIFASTNGKSVAIGTFTGRVFQSGSGLRPAAAPRYIIEILQDPHGESGQASPSSTPTQWIYRITAMGYGPTLDTQVVLQMIYRKAG